MTDPTFTPDPERDARLLADLREWRARLDSQVDGPWSMRLTIDELDMLLRAVDERDGLKRELAADPEAPTYTRATDARIFSVCQTCGDRIHSAASRWYDGERTILHWQHDDEVGKTHVAVGPSVGLKTITAPEPYFHAEIPDEVRQRIEDDARKTHLAKRIGLLPDDEQVLEPCTTCGGVGEHARECLVAKWLCGSCGDPIYRRVKPPLGTPLYAHAEPKVYDHIAYLPANA